MNTFIGMTVTRIAAAYDYINNAPSLQFSPSWQMFTALATDKATETATEQTYSLWCSTAVRYLVQRDNRDKRYYPHRFGLRLLPAIFTSPIDTTVVLPCKTQ